MAQPILTLAAEWASFEATLGGVSDPEIRMVFRRAFYAGALAILHIQTHPGRGGSREPTEAEMAARMEAISEELTQFAGEIAKGEA
jgi:hypothetical protein